MANIEKELLKSYFKSRKLAIENQSILWNYSEAEYLQKTLSKDKIFELDAFSSAANKADYFNKYVVGEVKFDKVYRFNLANKTIGTAIIVDGYRTYINKNGEESVEGISFDQYSDLDDGSQKIIAAMILNVDKYDVELAVDMHPDNYPDLDLYNDEFISVQLKDGTRLAIDKNMNPADKKQFSNIKY